MAYFSCALDLISMVVKVVAVSRTGMEIMHGLFLGGHVLCVDYLLKWKRMIFAF